MSRFQDRVCLVTGAASGIGHATAFAFAKEGADVAIVYLKEEEDAKQQLESFLRSPRVSERTDDDLTLLLATFSSNV